MPAERRAGALWAFFLTLKVMRYRVLRLRRGTKGKWCPALVR